MGTGGRWQSSGSPGHPASAAENAATRASSSRTGVIQAGSAALPLKTRCGAQHDVLPQKHPCSSQEGWKGSDPAFLRTPRAVTPLPGFYTTLFACPDTTDWSGRPLASSSIRPARCCLLRAWITPLTREAGIPARLLLWDWLCFGFGGHLTSRRDVCTSRVALVTA